MQFPPDTVLDSERLLYTAQYRTPFDKTARQCGLLLDEWTEVDPRRRRAPPASPSTSTGPTMSRRRTSCWSRRRRRPAPGNGTISSARSTRRFDLAKKRSVEPSAARRHALHAAAAGHRHGGDALRHLDHHQSCCRQWRVPHPGGAPMSSCAPHHRHPPGAGATPVPVDHHLEPAGGATAHARASTARCAPRCATRCGCSPSNGRWASSRQRRRLAGLREAADRPPRD